VPTRHFINVKTYGRLLQPSGQGGFMPRRAVKAQPLTNLKEHAAQKLANTILSLRIQAIGFLLEFDNGLTANRR
jgi:hypothetical protein